MGTATGGRADRGDDVLRSRVDGDLRTERAGQVERGRCDVDGHDPRPARDRDHHGGQADPAAAVDGDPLPLGDPALGDDGAERSGDPAAERRGGHRSHAVRQRDEVDVRMVEGHEVGEGPPAGEAGLGLALADLVVAGQALLARTAGADEGDRHAVAGVPPGDSVARRCDAAGELVTGDVRQRDRPVVAGPPVPVAAAQPGGLDLDDDTMLRRRRVGDLADRCRPAELLEHHRPHSDSLGSLDQRPKATGARATARPSTALPPALPRVDHAEMVVACGRRKALSTIVSARREDAGGQRRVRRFQPVVGQPAERVLGNGIYARRPAHALTPRATERMLVSSGMRPT